MSRKRLIVEQGWYHVMNRGHSRRHLFISDDFYLKFIQVMELAIDRYGIEIHAYCLMGNHYHLLIHDRKNCLGDAMRYINSHYARLFNQSRGREGALFSGRYKSLVIDSNRYLANVCRYIHLNPIAAGLVKKPDEYKWSSYSAYVSQSKGYFDSLNISMMNKIIEDMEAYCRLGIPEKILKIYSKLRLPQVLK